MLFNGMQVTQRMGFRTKTILGVALIELAMLAILVGSVLSILRESNEIELTRRVHMSAQLLAAAAKDALLAQDLATLDSLVGTTMASGQVDYVRIMDSAGVVLGERGDHAVLSRPFRRDAEAGDVDDGMFDWSVPVTAGGLTYGEVRLGVSTDPLKSLLASAMRWAVIVATSGMLLVALFSWLLGAYLVRQLVALRDASNSLAGGNYALRIPVHGRDEMAQAAMAFNHMAEALGKSNELLRHENQRRLQVQNWLVRALDESDDRAQQLNAIFALSPDGFVSFDDELRVKYANQAFLRMTSLSDAQIVGQDEVTFARLLAQLCKPEAQFPSMETMRKLCSGQAVGDDSGEDAARRLIELKEPQNRVLEVGMRLSRAESISQILYFRDVTHKTEIDRLKSEFLSTAAHELRTPMASIYGFSELMLAQEFSEDERREFLGAIHRQSQLMASIINELLDLARIEERGGKDFNFVRLDLRDVLGELVSSFKAPDGRPAPQLLSFDEPCPALVDRNKLMQAIGNVLSNAYKYSPAGGAVIVGLFRRAETQDCQARVGLHVSDRGIGMTEEQLSHIFERFYRADDSGKILGAGLGMSIVKEIIELHGGEVAVASALGEGSSVTLQLPLVS